MTEKPFIHAVPDSMHPKIFRVRARPKAEPQRINGDWVTGKKAVTPGLILAEASIHCAIIFAATLVVLWAMT